MLGSFGGATRVVVTSRYSSVPDADSTGDQGGNGANDSGADGQTRDSAISVDVREIDAAHPAFIRPSCLIAKTAGA